MILVPSVLLACWFSAGENNCRHKAHKNCFPQTPTTTNLKTTNKKKTTLTTTTHGTVSILFILFTSGVEHDV